MCRHICLHFPHSECTYTSAKRIPTYVPSIPLLQAPLWHSPSGLYIVEHRMCKWPTSEKGVVISEKYPQHMKSSRYRKSWPFQLITSKASGPATVQQLVLDSIQIDQTTLRRGCRDTGEEWSHRRIDHNNRWKSLCVHSSVENMFIYISSINSHNNLWSGYYFSHFIDEETKM